MHARQCYTNSRGVPRLAASRSYVQQLAGASQALPDRLDAAQATYFGMIWTNGAGASTGMFVPALAVGATGGRMAGRIVKAVVRHVSVISNLPILLFDPANHMQTICS